MLCEKNETYAVVNPRINGVLTINGRRLLGVVGQAIDRILIKFEKRRCRLIGEATLGEESANGSWSGNLGLLQRKEALAYIKPEAPIVQANWIKTTMPFLTENFLISQGFDLKKDPREPFNLLQNLNFGVKITALFLSVYLFSSFFIFFLNRMKKVLAQQAVSKFSLKQIVSSCLNITDKVFNISPSMGIFILILELYLWLFMLMVCNTTKTNKVVINTDHIILTVKDALNTEKTLCLLEDDTEYTIATMASKENPIRKVYDQRPMKKPIKGAKEKFGRCFLEKSDRSASVDLKEFFIIIADQAHYVLASFIGMVKSNVAWFLTEPIYQESLKIYHVYEDDTYIDKITSLHLESGLFIDVFQRFQLNALVIFNNNENRVYSTLNEYSEAMEEMTEFDNLALANFKMVFACLFLFFSALIFVFTFHLIWSKAYNYDRKEPKKRRQVRKSVKIGKRRG